MSSWLAIYCNYGDHIVHHTISMQCSKTFLKVDYFLISNVYKVILEVITSIETSGMPPLKKYCFAKGKLAAHM